MTGLIVAAIVGVMIIAGAIIAVRLTQPPDQVPPRRREFNKLRATQLNAVNALNEIDDVLDTYQRSVDDVGAALIGEVKTRIKEHDRRRMELEK